MNSFGFKCNGCGRTISTWKEIHQGHCIDCQNTPPVVKGDGKYHWSERK